jgi:sigma-B regulation protein RsbQ
MLATIEDDDQAILKRFNVQVIGAGEQTLVFCNGFNCSQQVWRLLTPMLVARYRLVLFDQVGTGQADPAAYDVQKYKSFQGYAQDIIDICQALDVREAVLIGHSAGAMMSVLAAIQAPHHFAKVVLIAASPHYLNEPGYYGGFERQQVLDLLGAMHNDYQNWASSFAQMLIGDGYEDAVGYELTSYFCQSNAVIAERLAYLTFLGDNRADVSQLQLPTLLIQCEADVAVPPEVAAYLAANIPHATLVTLDATGHCPHLSAPLQVLTALKQFLTA